jgi:threonine/homoserine/homoserine lactone efflux protein
MWRNTGTLKLDQDNPQGSAIQIVVKGILINLLNPKLTLFFFAFLPLFVSQDALSPTKQMAGLGLIFMLMTFVIFVLYGILASWVSSFLINSPKTIRLVQRSFAIIFALLAMRLALSQQ